MRWLVAASQLQLRLLFSYRRRFIAALASLLMLAGLSASAAMVTFNQTQGNHTDYPYDWSYSDPYSSFVINVNASKGGATGGLLVSTFQGQLGIVSDVDSTGDDRHMNANEALILTFNEFDGVSPISITDVNVGNFGSGQTLEFYKNGLLVVTVQSDGSGSGYPILPAIEVVEGDVIEVTPSGNVRLESLSLDFDVTFPASDEPYIADAATQVTLLDTVVSEEGHYFLTADWTGLAHLPAGVVVKVGDGNASSRLYYMGETGPTSRVDFDLLILQPGDTIKVVAGLTGDAGEDPGLWTTSLDRYDSWSGSRIEVETVPLGLASPLSGLDIYKDLWPRTHGFRNDYRGLRGEDTVLAFVAETLGHAPKVFDEEVPFGSPNLPYLQAYAENNPDRQVLAHWNGKGINLSLDNSEILPDIMAQFKPYHFRYLVGSYLSSAISATDTQITVDDGGRFIVDEVAIIVPVDPVTGERDFDGSEMVLVTAINGNQLTVVREAYNDKISNAASAFGAGSYIAPSSKNSRYNYSLTAPVGSDGLNGSDMVIKMLTHEFKPEENLERFHGLMFDVLTLGIDETEDLNLDGVADGRYDARGIDLYHLGVQGMARKLRAALPGRILTFDGPSGGWPSLQTVFNGIEAEGFSHHHDTYTKKWSLSPNYFLYTKRWNPSEYQYNFCVPKQGGEPSPGSPEESLRVNRYHMAGMVAMGINLSHSIIQGSIFGPFYAKDEMVKGVDVEQQWLGAPLGDLVRPGFSAPDQLGGSGLPSGGWSSPDGSATVSVGPEGILVQPLGTEVDHDMTIEFSGISIPEGDLLIRFEGKGGLPHYPSDTARDIRIQVDGRVDNGLTDDTLSGPVNNEGFTEVTAYYRSAAPAGGSNVTLRLIIESAEDMTLRNFTIHNATDTMVREFENGIVLCNPSENPHTFDLASMFPGQHFRRIQGRVLYKTNGDLAYDETAVNDGSAVGSSVQLDGYRGLFLVKELDLVSVVDFDHTGSEDVDGRSADESNSQAAIWNFSDTLPLITAEDGSNVIVYGGVTNEWTVASTYTPFVRYLPAEFQNQVNPNNGSDTSAEGMLVWKKSDFLNGSNMQTVSLASGGALSCTVSVVTGTREVHFVVKQNGNYYVSEAFTTTTGAFSISPSATNWVPISTTDYNTTGSYTATSFTNVEAVGLYYSVTRNSGQALLKISDFNLSVDSDGLTSNTDPIFNADPIIAPDATEGVFYSSPSLAGYASDNDGDTLTYSKSGVGVDWLSVASNGSLSGTPGAIDVGLNTVTVQLDDGSGGTATAELQITVVAAPPLEVDLKITPSGSGGGSGSIDITWVGESGTSYQLQGRADLATGTWENVGEAVIGDGSVITIPITPLEDTYFYRVVEQ